MQSQKESILSREQRTGVRDVAARRAFNRALIGGSDDDECGADVAERINARHTQVGFRRFKCNEKKCRYDEDTKTCVSPKLERLLKDLADTRAKLEASRARQAKLDRDLEKEKLNIEELDRTKRDINEVAEFVRKFLTDWPRILDSPREERVSKIDELISSYEAIRDETTNEKLREKVQEFIQLVLKERSDFDKIARNESK